MLPVQMCWKPLGYLLLNHFQIPTWGSVLSFPEEEMMLPPSLIDISIESFENLECMLSNDFRNLTYLQYLSISDCTKLTAFPEKDILLSFGRLAIWNCPLLNKECKRGKGQEWSKTVHIPCVQIWLT